MMSSSIHAQFEVEHKGAVDNAWRISSSSEIVKEM